MADIIKFATLARDLVPDSFAEQLALGVSEHQSEIDAKIEQYAIGWAKKRLSRVVLTVLRLAFFELLFTHDVPDSVIINEAVELTKQYGTTEDSAFVNGILGAFSRAERKETEKKPAKRVRTPKSQKIEHSEDHEEAEQINQTKGAPEE